jgi:hypothetical protein
VDVTFTVCLFQPGSPPRQPICQAALARTEAVGGCSDGDALELLRRRGSPGDKEVVHARDTELCDGDTGEDIARFHRSAQVGSHAPKAVAFLSGVLATRGTVLIHVNRLPRTA